jgi:hypothetical protein
LRHWRSAVGATSPSARVIAETGFQPTADDPSARVEGRALIASSCAIASGLRILVNRGTYFCPLGRFTSMSSAINWKTTTLTLGQGRTGA